MCVCVGGSALVLPSHHVLVCFLLGTYNRVNTMFKKKIRDMAWQKKRDRWYALTQPTRLFEGREQKSAILDILPHLLHMHQLSTKPLQKQASGGRAPAAANSDSKIKKVALGGKHPA